MVKLSKIRMKERIKNSDDEAQANSDNAKSNATVNKAPKKEAGKQKSKTRKRKVARDSSTSSGSSSDSSSSSSSSNSSSGKSAASPKHKKRSKKTSATKHALPSDERPKHQPNDEYTDEAKVQEQRSRWDSPERGGQRHNSSRNNKSRRRSRSRSHERGRDRDRDNQIQRERNARERSRDRRPRSPAQRQRGRSNDRRDRRRDDERRPQRRSRSRSPRDRQRNRDNRDRDFANPRRNHQRRDDRNRGEEHYEWGKQSDDKAPPPDDEKSIEKEKPNFGLSGALTEDTNKVNGVVIKYSEPLEARKPKRRWRLYPFKGETALPTLHIHRQSCFLVGRDRKVVDLAVDHPSCSKQHAALQYRLVPFEREDGTLGKRVRLYIIDLESANGTFLNNKKIDGRKYYELMEKDVIKFGFSSREYVLLHENSKEDQEDDDVHIKEEPEDIPAEPNP
ncbi:smad nuclear-interacting protein 1 [Scaptodrosophila lebanonensis]|uniref:Smad nuclear-interacting protein 1 n=1 Tax=Drosophila lebanonensis TaxID=7225 RepID=A0A6J2TVG4_DROLE|nr:smad nuclear-interacting protein 1 [Scaptodrosophila lebanonensis]